MVNSRAFVDHLRSAPKIPLTILVVAIFVAVTDKTLGF